MKDYTKQITFIMQFTFIGAILLLTVPTIMALFFSITPMWFKILNTLGWVLATIRIVLSLATTVTIIAVKGEATVEKKKLDKESKTLFFAVIILQLINFMFINFN